MMHTPKPGESNGSVSRVVRANEAARQRFAEELDELLAAIREATERARRARVPPPPAWDDEEARDG